MSDTYAKMNSIAASVTGQNFTDAVPKLNTLETIAELNKFMKGGDSIDADLKPFADNELQYLKAAMKLINTVPDIRAKFGQTMEGATALADIVKFTDSQTLFQKMIDSVKIERPKLGSQSSAYEGK
jgi:hypothetical protein